MSLLLDTCVLAEGRKPQPDVNVASWLDERDPAELFLSSVTLGELWKGASQHPDQRRREKLEDWIEQVLLVEFHGRILSLEADVARLWGSLQGGLAGVAAPSQSWTRSSQPRPSCTGSRW